MQSVVLFSNSSPFIPLCLRALFTPSRMKGALSFFFHRYPLLLSRCSLDSWQQAEWEWKTHRCLRKTRERERKRGGRLRDKVPCFVLRVSCEVRGRGIKESRKMNVSHEHHSLPSFQADSIHLLSIPLPPYSALFLSRASVLRVSLRMEACFEPSRNSSRLRPGFPDGQ